ncbi:hypothetical protein GCM10022206_54940 [Streptomyces chiangmaiensis]
MRHINRLGLSAATAVAAALCFAPLTSAAAPAAGPQPTGGQGEVIHLTAVTTPSTSIDLVPLGPSQGDELIVAGNVSRRSPSASSADPPAPVPCRAEPVELRTVHTGRPAPHT